MVTRVRIEAEGSTTREVEEALQTAHEVLIQRARPAELAAMFGEGHGEGGAYHPGLADAQMGEFVVERFARDTGGEAGHGAVIYRGRMTSHFAAPAKVQKLNRRSEAQPYVAE